LENILTKAICPLWGEKQT